MRAVVDTNILVSGLLRAASLPAAVLRDIVTRRLTPVVCSEILAEYRQALHQPRLRLHAPDIDALLVLIDLLAVRVSVPPYTGTPPLPDVTDWPFIACALAAACPVVAGNLKHFPADLGVQVMTARQWMAGER